MTSKVTSKERNRYNNRIEQIGGNFEYREPIHNSVDKFDVDVFGHTKNGYRIEKTEEMILEELLEKFQTKVNNMIQHGWIPQGGICKSGNSEVCDLDGQTFRFYQSMVRYKDWWNKMKEKPSTDE